MDIEEVMTIDLLGNIKLCQNTGDDYILGTVDNIDNATLEGTKHDFHVDRCSTCEVQALCQSNCPLIVDDTLFDMNCKINKAHYRAIQEVALKIMFNEIH
jgi:radical SAM protein with 4Fe4S-binding SPASM domain